MNQSPVTSADLANALRTIPDFPKPGIQFKDITPILASAHLFRGCVELLVQPHPPGTIDAVVGIDARGFIFGGAAALRLGAGFVPVRKGGKLPSQTYEQSYDLEYGSSTVAIHADALGAGQRVLLIDDLLATGGTAAAAAALVRRSGATIVEVVFAVELTFLQGRARLADVPVRSLIRCA